MMVAEVPALASSASFCRRRFPDQAKQHTGLSLERDAQDAGAAPG